MARVKTTRLVNPSPNTTVQCWQCRGVGEVRKRMYHNDKRMETCPSCAGAGSLKFREVPDAHKKYYQKGRFDKLSYAELQKIKESNA